MRIASRTEFSNPIEYELSGINQVSVRNDIGLDFASALRSILRQDPDIVMVGEIRDVETADISIRAAMAYPCCGPIDASVWRTMRSSVPCRMSVFSDSRLVTPKEYYGDLWDVNRSPSRSRDNLLP